MTALVLLLPSQDAGCCGCPVVTDLVLVVAGLSGMPLGAGDALQGMCVAAGVHMSGVGGTGVGGSGDAGPGVGVPALPAAPVATLLLFLSPVTFSS